MRPLRSASASADSRVPPHHLARRRAGGVRPSRRPSHRTVGLGVVRRRRSRSAAHHCAGVRLHRSASRPRLPFP
eukprot:scaffold13751_cov108-Isochrysis_galbana.AAC.5